MMLMLYYCYSQAPSTWLASLHTSTTPQVRRFRDLGKKVLLIKVLQSNILLTTQDHLGIVSVYMLHNIHMG